MQAHDHRDLRDALRRHLCLVEEDPAEVVAVGKTSSCMGRKAPPSRPGRCTAGGSARRPPVRPQVLLDGEGVIRPALDRRVVGTNDHALDALDDADARDPFPPPALPAVGSHAAQRVQARETPSRDRAGARPARVRKSFPRPRWRSTASRQSAAAKFGALAGSQRAPSCALCSPSRPRQPGPRGNRERPLLTVGISSLPMGIAYAP